METEGGTSAERNQQVFTKYLFDCYNERACKVMTANMKRWEENELLTFSGQKSGDKSESDECASRLSSDNTSSCCDIYNECYTIVNNLKQYGRKLIIPSTYTVQVNHNFCKYFQETGHAYAIDVTSTYVVPLMLDLDCKKCTRRKLVDDNCGLSKDSWCHPVSEHEIAQIKDNIIKTISTSSNFEALGKVIFGEGASTNVVVYKKRGTAIDCNLHIYFSNVAVSLILYDLLIDYLTLHLDERITEKYLIDKVSSIPLPYSAKHEYRPYLPVCGTHVDVNLSASTDYFFDVSGLSLVQTLSPFKEIQVCQLVSDQERERNESVDDEEEEDDDDGSYAREEYESDELEFEDDCNSGELSDSWFTLDKNIGRFLVHDLQWKAISQSKLPDFVVYSRLTNRRLKEAHQSNAIREFARRSAKYLIFVAYINNYTTGSSAQLAETYRLMESRIQTLAFTSSDSAPGADHHQRKACILKNLRLLSQRIAVATFRKEQKYVQSLSDAQLFTYLVRFIFGPQNNCGYSFYVIFAICLFLQRSAITSTMDKREEAVRIKNATLEILSVIFTAGINFVHTSQAKLVKHILDTLRSLDCFDQLAESLGVPENVFSYVTTLMRLDVLSTHTIGELFRRVRSYMKVKAARIDTELTQAAEISSKREFMNYCIERAEEINEGVQALFEEWLRTTIFVYRGNTNQESVYVYTGGSYIEVDEKITESSKSSLLCKLENEYLRPLHVKISKNFNFNQRKVYQQISFVSEADETVPTSSATTRSNRKGGGGGGRISQDVFCKLETVRTLFQRAWSSFLEKKCTIQTECNGFYPFFVNTSIGIFNTLTGQYMLPIPFLYFATHRIYCTIPVNGYSFEPLPISTHNTSVDSGKLLKFNSMLCSNYPSLKATMKTFLTSQSTLFYFSMLIPGLLSLPLSDDGGHPDENMSVDGDALFNRLEEVLQADLNKSESERELYYLAPAILRFNYPIHLVLTLVEVLHDLEENDYSIFSSSQLDDFLQRQESCVVKYAESVAARVAVKYAGSTFSYLDCFNTTNLRYESIYDDFNVKQLAEHFPGSHPRTIFVAYVSLMVDKYTRVLEPSAIFSNILATVEQKLSITDRVERRYHRYFPYTQGEQLWLSAYHRQLGQTFGLDRAMMTILFYDDNNDINCWTEMYRLVVNEGLNLTNFHRAVNLLARKRGQFHQFSALPKGFIEMCATVSLLFTFNSPKMGEFMVFMVETYQPGLPRKHIILLFGVRYGGKSTILKLIECSHGPSVFGLPNRLGNCATAGGPNTEIMALNRAYAGLIQEMSSANAAVLRVLTGSDSQHYRSMYKDVYIKFRCSASIIAASNSLIRIVNYSATDMSRIDADEAIKERIAIFRCSNVFYDLRAAKTNGPLVRNPLFFYNTRRIPMRNIRYDHLAKAFSNMIYATYLIHRANDGNIKPTLENACSVAWLDKLMMKNNYVYRVLGALGIVRDHTLRINQQTLKAAVEDLFERWRSQSGDRQSYTWDMFLADFEVMFSDCVPVTRYGKRKHEASVTYHGVGFK